MLLFCGFNFGSIFAFRSKRPDCHYYVANSVLCHQVVIRQITQDISICFKKKKQMYAPVLLFAVTAFTGWRLSKESVKKFRDIMCIFSKDNILFP